VLSTVVPRLLPLSLAVLATLFVAFGTAMVWPQEEATPPFMATAAEADAQPVAPLQGDPGAILAPVTLTPVLERGVPSGFSLGKVAPGSLFQHMGLQEGDVLISFNDLGDGAAPHLVVHMERAGRPMRLEYMSVPRDQSASLLRPMTSPTGEE
jgi:hypothetical protein